jgi:hypothetical protein
MKRAYEKPSFDLGRLVSKQFNSERPRIDITSDTSTVALMILNFYHTVCTASTEIQATVPNFHLVSVELINWVYIMANDHI